MDLLSESDDEIDLINNIRAPKDRQFKMRTNYIEELDDCDFLKRFRISKETFLLLCDEIRVMISPATNR